MGRVIKFRAWDGERIRSWGSCDFIITASGAVEILEFSQRLQPSWQLMQFTGLHDKNGVEIYEGDIVCNANAGGPKNRLIAWADAYAGPMFCECDKNGKAEQYYYGGIESDVLVIGNIHQNPELMEVKS